MSITLLQHIESLNAKADLLMEQEPGTVVFKITDDLSHWHDMGVYTVEDFRRYELIAGISDASKDLNGCRMRLEWDEMTTEELEAVYDSICRQLDHVFEMERAEAEWEAEMSKGLVGDPEPLPYEEYEYLEGAV